ncbi:MAG: sialidase family protein [Verrucomicrobiota bacterium]
MKNRLILIFSGAVFVSYFCHAAETKKSETRFVAEQLTHRTIYRSPQKPGYTSWVGLWKMPDDSMMVTFKQVTGPIEGRKEKDYDYSGLVLANIYLHSTNGGVTWTKTGEDIFNGPSERPVWGGSHCVLTNGEIIRAVDGSQLPSNSVPRQIFFQRSMDLGKTWGKAEIPPEPARPTNNFIGDFGDCISRVRRLSNGWLIATGVIRTDPSPRKRMMGDPLVMFSKDDGKTWEPQKIEMPDPDMHASYAWNEWDCAELPDGNLLGVFRRTDPKSVKFKQVRWQGLLRKKGDGWLLDEYHPAHFEHSGHPEVLSTREGIVLHIATSGIDWTADSGKAWHSLEAKERKGPIQSHYYPVSVQAKDGRIYIVSHAGSDNAYGKIDQSIVMDSFRLNSE